jgi:hypothetical protein
MSIQNNIGKEFKRNYYNRIITSPDWSITKNRGCAVSPMHQIFIEELYEHDDELLDKINSMEETIKLLKQQKEDDRKRIDTLEKDYKQLMTNWTTITEYMKRIDVIEEYLNPIIKEQKCMEERMKTKRAT